MSFAIKNSMPMSGNGDVYSVIQTGKRRQSQRNSMTGQFKSESVEFKDAPFPPQREYYTGKPTNEFNLLKGTVSHKQVQRRSLVGSVEDYEKIKAKR